MADIDQKLNYRDITIPSGQNSPIKSNDGNSLTIPAAGNERRSSNNTKRHLKKPSFNLARESQDSENSIRNS